MYYALLTLFIITAVLLIIVTLMQKGRGDVGAAFGSAMGSSLFGVGGVDTILTKLTYWLGGIFLLLAVVLSIVPKEERGSILKEELRNEAPPADTGSRTKPSEGRSDNTGSPGGNQTPGSGSNR